jgi:predicted signal transduction protein with EAL and GGDEF domain
MTLLAEGVETEREIGVLREMGVRQAQGYAITPPLGPAELVEYFSRSRRGRRPARRSPSRCGRAPPETAAARARAYG